MDIIGPLGLPYIPGQTQIDRQIDRTAFPRTDGAVNSSSQLMAILLSSLVISPIAHEAVSKNP